MPYAQHRRLSFRGIFGTLAAPFEEWQFRINLGPVVAQFDPADLTPAVTAYQTRLAVGFASATRLTEVKFANIGTDGRYTEEPVILETDVPGAAAGSNDLPPQIALAVSLGSATRGARGRGRFYLPPPQTNRTMTASGTLDNASRDVWQQRAALFVQDLQDWAETGPVIIASTFGVNSPVTEVRVGAVLDTVRSRRRSIPEGYTVPTVITSAP